MKISAVVLTKNEAKNIRACLKTLQFCDEIIVVDDHSQDQTRQIAKKMGAKIFTRMLEKDFSAQRNFGLKQARNEWVLFVDADERVSPGLAREITNYKFNITYDDGFYVKRDDLFLGRWLRFGETAQVKLIRLARKRAGRWHRKVHEVWQIPSGSLGQLKNPLLHDPHPNLSAFLSQINDYTTLDAQAFDQAGKRFQLWQLFFYPLAKFFLNYCWRLGFLDGYPGLIMALMMSFHSLITRIKLWERQK